MRFAAQNPAPSDEGAEFCAAKDGGRESFSFFSPSVFAYGESTSLIRGRLSAEAGHSKSFHED